MSYTVLELAKLALAVYKDPPPKVDDWIPVRKFGTNAKHGFYAGLYRNEALFVLAYRGTDDWQVDLIDDTAILLGWISHQMAQARTALREAQMLMSRTPAGMNKPKLCVTGHSLGGGLAALIAAQTDLPCVTFNAPGTERSLRAHYTKYVASSLFASMIKLTMPHEVYDGRILNVRARFDIVSVGTGPAIGITDSINVKCEGPSGKPVSGPVQAGVDGLVQSIIRPKPQGVFVADFAFATAVANYEVCQHQMSRILNEVAAFDKYNRDLEW